MVHIGLYPGNPYQASFSSTDASVYAGADARAQCDQGLKRISLMNC